MSSIDTIIAEVSASAQADAGQDDPETHAKLLQSIWKLLLAAEKPLETAKRIVYQVSDRHHTNQPSNNYRDSKSNAVSHSLLQTSLSV